MILFKVYIDLNGTHLQWVLGAIREEDVMVNFLESELMDAIVPQLEHDFISIERIEKVKI